MRSPRGGTTGLKLPTALEEPTGRAVQPSLFAGNGHFPDGQFTPAAVLPEVENKLVRSGVGHRARTPAPTADQPTGGEPANQTVLAQVAARWFGRSEQTSRRRLRPYKN